MSFRKRVASFLCAACMLVSILSVSRPAMVYAGSLDDQLQEARDAQAELEKQVDFSEVGVEHLNKMLDVCIASYLYALEAFESNDRESALKTIEKETEADGLEISLRAKHIKRLTNQQCNTEAGVVFLDSLVCLERISDHARNIAEEVLAE